MRIIWVWLINRNAANIDYLDTIGNTRESKAFFNLPPLNSARQIDGYKIWQDYYPARQIFHFKHSLPTY